MVAKWKVVVWLVIAGAFAAWAQEASQRVKVGDVAPDFELSDLEGKAVKLSDLAKDEKVKVVAVNFMSHT